MPSKRQVVLIALLEKITPFPVSARFCDLPYKPVGAGEITVAHIRVQKADLGDIGRVFGLFPGRFGLVFRNNRGIPRVFGKQTLVMFAVPRLIDLPIRKHGQPQDHGRSGCGNV